MMDFLKTIGRIFGAILPYAALVYAMMFFLLKVETLRADNLTIQLQNQELYANQVSMFTELTEVQASDLLIMEQLAKGQDAAKADAIKKNNAIMKLIYGVDKASTQRDSDIVTGVNGLVDSFNHTLQKPSYDYLKSITVRVIARDKDADNKPDGSKGWMGTGCIIGITKDFTYILTNRHVMDKWGDGTHDYYLKEEDGTKYTVTAIKISANEAVDLALIRIDGHIDGKRAVVGFGDVAPADPVFMVGMDLGRPWFYSEGTVSGFDPNTSDELVVGMPVGPGNSGSGVIDREGRLVGLLYAGSIISEDLIYQMDIAHGLCVPIKAIRLFLAGYISE